MTVTTICKEQQTYGEGEPGAPEGLGQSNVRAHFLQMSHVS